MKSTLQRSNHVWLALILAVTVWQKDAGAALNVGLRSTTTPMLVGQKVTWIADSWQSNLDPLQYRFSVTATDGTMVMMRSWGHNHSLDWILTIPGPTR